MKFDQVAIRVLPGNTFEQTIGIVQEIYGLDPGGWSDDTVIATGEVFPQEEPQENKALLSFNYPSAGNLEIEVIQYIDGPNFHKFLNGPISHFGIHMNNLEEFQYQFEVLSAKWKLFQHVTTVSHTNPYVVRRNRRYEYAIFDTRPITGAFTKLIRRIEGS